MKIHHEEEFNNNYNRRMNLLSSSSKREGEHQALFYQINDIMKSFRW